MNIKTSELTGAALDWAVAEAEGRKPSSYKGTVRATAHPHFPDSPPMFGPELNYSTDWAQGGPIIERERICINAFLNCSDWNACSYNDDKVRQFLHKGPTPLIAAMRCYVASKLGNKVEIPDELV